VRAAAGVPGGKVKLSLEVLPRVLVFIGAALKVGGITGL
jgi:hypothetical protein